MKKFEKLFQNYFFKRKFFVDEDLQKISTNR